MISKPLRFLTFAFTLNLAVLSNPISGAANNNAQRLPSAPTAFSLMSSETLLAQAEETEALTPGEKANADFQDQLAGAELLSALKEGGYVIYFRHAQTEKDYADQVTADVNNCSTQRTLSEAGWQDAETIGSAFQTKEIPVGSVISSQYCRAWQTASLAFGQYEKNPALNFLPFEDYTEAQVEQMKANVMPLLTAVPDAGSNTVIVGHDDIFESATGVYPDPQGMAYVVKPDGQGAFDIIANLLPQEWSEL